MQYHVAGLSVSSSWVASVSTSVELEKRSLWRESLERLLCIRSVTVGCHFPPFNMNSQPPSLTKSRSNIGNSHTLLQDGVNGCAVLQVL